MRHQQGIEAMRMTKEQRRAQGHEWAENWRERTGEGPGRERYAAHYMYGYFNYSGARADSINTDILEQFEALLDRITLLEQTFVVTNVQDAVIVSTNC